MSTEKRRGRWPQTVEEAVTRILSQMSVANKEQVRATPKKDLTRFHHGWGTGIRNAFGLWAGNQALLDDCRRSHPDSASMVIIEAVWERLHQEEGTREGG